MSKIEITNPISSRYIGAHGPKQQDFKELISGQEDLKE